MLLEHELWLYASRHDAARGNFAERFAEARRMVVDSIATWPAEGRADPPGTPEQVAPLLVALLVGLEMQHRVDPDAISDETAVLGIRAVTGLHDIEPPAPAGSRSTPAGTSRTKSGPRTKTSTPRRKTTTRRTS